MGIVRHLWLILNITDIVRLFVLTPRLWYSWKKIWKEWEKSVEVCHLSCQASFNVSQNVLLGMTHYVSMLPQTFLWFEIVPQMTLRFTQLTCVYTWRISWSDNRGQQRPVSWRRSPDRLFTQTYCATYKATKGCSKAALNIIPFFTLFFIETDILNVYIAITVVLWIVSLQCFANM